MVRVDCAPILSLSLVSAQKSCTWPISPLCFPSLSVTVYFSPTLFNSLLALRSTASSFPLLFSSFLRFLTLPPSSLPPPHLARTLQFSLEELVPSSIPIDAASSFPYKQLGLYGILTRASTLCIVHKYICIVYMLLLCLRNHIILDIVPHRECTLCTLLFKSISNEYACKRCVYTDEC